MSVRGDDLARFTALVVGDGRGSKTFMRYVLARAGWAPTAIAELSGVNVRAVYRDIQKVSDRAKRAGIEPLFVQKIGGFEL